MANLKGYKWVDEKLSDFFEISDEDAKAKMDAVKPTPEPENSGADGDEIVKIVDDTVTNFETYSKSGR